MDRSRPFLRALAVPLVSCLALSLGALPAGAETSSQPTSGTPSPTDEEQTTDVEPTAPAPSSAGAPSAATDESTGEPTGPTEEEPPAPQATRVSLVRSAGTTAPQEPVRGRVTATTTAGAPLVDAVVEVVLSGPSPRTVELRTSEAGTATYAFEKLRSGAYTVRAEVVADATHAASSTPAVPVDVQASRWVTLLVNSGYGTRVATGENFWLRGRVLTTRGAADPGATVRLYRYSGSRAVRVATLRTGSTGWFTWSPKDRRAGTYRAVVSSVRLSGKQTVRIGGGTRTLAQRETSLAWLLGAPQSTATTKAGRTWRTYARGVLVQSGTRTWVVRGTPLRELTARGGPGGTLGAPTGDVRCGLPEGGCLQQFRTGAIYANPKAKDTLTSAVAPTKGAADLVAVARSQLGYREPSPRKSKYNKWIGRTGPGDPWCGFFQSWLAYAAGKPGAVMRKTSFPRLRDAYRSSGRTTSKPAVGRLAFIRHSRLGTVTHVGIVSKVSDRYVWTIEGNVSAGGGNKFPRGVHEVKRTKAWVSFYADPRY